MDVLTETDREYWCGVLIAGGFTAIPRCALYPVSGTAEHEAKIPDDLVTALRRLADELAVTVSSVLLAAHAKVLATLSGERDVATGYVDRQGDQPLLCRLTTEPNSWRTLLLAASRAESELLAHRDFPVDDLRRDLGLTEPSFETVLDPTGFDPTGFDPNGVDGDLSEDTVLWVGIAGGGGELRRAADISMHEHKPGSDRRRRGRSGRQHRGTPRPHKSFSGSELLERAHTRLSQPRARRRVDLQRAAIESPLAPFLELAVLLRLSFAHGRSSATCSLSNSRRRCTARE